MYVSTHLSFGCKCVFAVHVSSVQAFALCARSRMWEYQSIDEQEARGETFPDPLGRSASTACLLLDGASMHLHNP